MTPNRAHSRRAELLVIALLTVANFILAGIVIAKAIP